MSCEFCKYAEWNFKLFPEVNTNRWGVTKYNTSQFDIHCTYDNSFFLESEMLSTRCNNCETGKNNYKNLVDEYYSLTDEIKNVGNSFEDYIEQYMEDNNEVIVKTSDKYNEIYQEYFKTHFKELFNRITESNYD